MSSMPCLWELPVRAGELGQLHPLHSSGGLPSWHSTLDAIKHGQEEDLGRCIIGNPFCLLSLPFTGAHSPPDVILDEIWHLLEFAICFPSEICLVVE